jgi:8-oxo-dGTP pyrophosphatase MutT (NUDIX family)
MRQSARGIIISNDQILLMDRNKFGFKYRSLIGGGIDLGETPEQTLIREVYEEASIRIQNLKLVIVEDAGSVYGHQYIYRCEYLSGKVGLNPDAEEYKIMQKGLNLYQPIWWPIAKIADANILPVELNRTLVDFFKNGFPDTPLNLVIAETSIR